MMKLENLQDLYIAELQDMHSAETQLTKALPKMAEACASDELRTAFEEHLEVTQDQIGRIEKILGELNSKPGKETCEAMRGLVTEGKEIMDESKDESVKDAGLIVAAQKVEHYEIAGYGGLRTFARMLGRDKDAELLQKSLDEEKEADARLTGIAEGFVNKQAL